LLLDINGERADGKISRNYRSPHYGLDASVQAKLAVFAIGARPHLFGV
jgi:hypothetical protein